jgi:hypothetical protein
LTTAWKSCSPAQSWMVLVASEERPLASVLVDGVSTANFKGRGLFTGENVSAGEANISEHPTLPCVCYYFILPNVIESRRA